MASQLTLPFARMPEFYLGMSQFEWLRNESLRDVNVFLSMRRLYERKNLPRDNLANMGKRGCADDCSQCLPFALAWRAALLKTIEAAVN